MRIATEISLVDTPSMSYLILNNRAVAGDDNCAQAHQYGPHRWAEQNTDIRKALLPLMSGSVMTCLLRLGSRSGAYVVKGGDRGSRQPAENEYP